MLHRNARIKRFIEQGAPDLILNQEKRLLQEACDGLFDNARSPRPFRGPGKQPLKSLTDALKGKQGRFRRNLLGKRVDYSGRSVICVGLDLKLHECGLPKNMALELFKPFVMRKLLDRAYASSPHHAKRLVERRDPLVWDLLAEVMQEKLVLLNRAPTLHRLSIQAFEATLVEGDAIRLHPLVCSAFNADFDGDQMAVHLPLSEEAQAEARELLLSTRNVRSPAAGEPGIALSQEIVLGCFYLTEDRSASRTAPRVFSDSNEARLAYDHGRIDLHTPLLVRLPGLAIYHAPPAASPPALPERGRVVTTVGRLIFNELLPQGLQYQNYPMTKEALKHLIAESLSRYGEEETARLADTLKRLGYYWATRSGISFAMSDMKEPPEKRTLVEQGQALAQEIQTRYQEGMITEQERDQQTIDLWTQMTEQISARLMALLDPFGTLATIVKSGATKARFQQIRQLSGIRGLLTDPSGRIIPLPVLGNYLSGLQVWEIFIAARGARKGFMDRSLNTAISGYLTRKLVEVGTEVWTTLDDCATTQGWLITQQESQAIGLPDMHSRIVGRMLAEPVADLCAGTILDDALVDHLLARQITAVRVRSPLCCEALYGICRYCYGRDLATGKLVRRGVAVGIIAGQSIGEPGTQLTMRTFHSGGIAHAQGDITQGLPRVNELFEARVPARAALLSLTAGRVQLERREATGRQRLRVSDPAAPFAERTYDFAAGQRLLVEEGQSVEIGTPLTAGPLDPQQLLKLLGREAVARYLVMEVQRVYRATGVYLNDKHIEIIVRQMLRSVQIVQSGDTDLLVGTIMDRFACASANLAVIVQGGSPALARPVLLGLTRTAFQTASWVAAASFQDTSRVLTQAAIRRQVDPLRGFKERIALGLPLPRG